MSRLELIPFVERYSTATVMCVGDVMLDHFVYGDVNRISPEAPIPVVRIRHENSMLGGAGNVARNLSSLGARVILLGVLGDDSSAAQLKEQVNTLARCTLHAAVDKTRKTSVKTRYISGGQQLLRVDAESTDGVEASVLDDLFAGFQSRLAECDVVILSDYAKGVLSGARAAMFIAAARAAGKPVFVDPKGRDFRRYREASMIKPNLSELADATGLAVASSVEVEAAARILMRETEIDSVLVTRGALGMMLVRRAAPTLSFSSVAREVYDVSGAGDTVAAAVAVGFASGMRLEDAIYVANVAAGIVVGKLGTATVTADQLLASLAAAD